MSDRLDYPSSWTPDQQAALDSLFLEAKRKRLYFYINALGTGELWFSPRQLQLEQENQKFLFSAENWKLRDPLERVQEYEQKIAALMDERNKFVREITKSIF